MQKVTSLGFWDHLICGENKKRGEGRLGEVSLGRVWEENDERGEVLEGVGAWRGLRGQEWRFVCL